MLQGPPSSTLTEETCALATGVHPGWVLAVHGSQTEEPRALPGPVTLPIPSLEVPNAT
jgi:hypothetical protein